MKQVRMWVAALALCMMVAPAAFAAGERRVENECFPDSGAYRVIERIWVLTGTDWVLVSERTWLAYECPLPIVE